MLIWGNLITNISNININHRFVEGWPPAELRPALRLRKTLLESFRFSQRSDSSTATCRWKNGGSPNGEIPLSKKTSTIAIENGTHHDSVYIYTYMIIHTLGLDNLMITSWQHHQMMIPVERTTGSSPLKGWPNHVCCPNAE